MRVFVSLSALQLPCNTQSATKFQKFKIQKVKDEFALWAVISNKVDTLSECLELVPCARYRGRSARVHLAT